MVNSFGSRLFTISIQQNLALAVRAVTFWNLMEPFLARSGGFEQWSNWIMSWTEPIILIVCLESKLPIVVQEIFVTQELHFCVFCNFRVTFYHCIFCLLCNFIYIFCVTFQLYFYLLPLYFVQFPHYPETLYAMHSYLSLSHVSSQCSFVRVVGGRWELVRGRWLILTSK